MKNEDESKQAASREQSEAGSPDGPPASSLSGEKPTVDTKRGLTAVKNARAARQRADVQVGLFRGVGAVGGAALTMLGGRNREAGKLPPLKVVGWALLVLAAASVVYFYREAAAVEQDRQALMADQRALDATLGKAWVPMRDAVEKLTIESAGYPTDDLIERDELKGFALQKESGIYLRLRLDQAATAEAIREGAQGSLHDGLTTCLMETAGDDAVGGKECQAAADCDEGQLCNEMDHCAKPTQPFNLRMAYHSMQVLSPDWVKQVQDASDRQRVHALRVTFDAAMKTDVPLAMELVGQAKFFLLVLDEKPPPPKEKDDVEVPAEDKEALAGKHYASRVFVYRLSDQKLLLRMRRDEGVRALGNPVADPRAEAARQRQIRACALALDVKGALTGH